MKCVCFQLNNLLWLNKKVLQLKFNKINLISNRSKMFNLCKTIKIYQTVNHYHLNPTNNNTHPLEHHQINYSENHLPTHTHNPPTHNHPLSDIQHPHHKRHGISLSIKNTQQHNSLENKKLMLSMSKKDFLRVSKTNISQLSSFKMKSTQRFQEEPKIIESKITYGSTSPRHKPYQQQTQSRKYSKEQEQYNLPEVPLKRENTRTTHASIAHQSVSNSQPNVQQQFSPLKRSTNFLRTSIRSKVEGNAKNFNQINIRINPESKMSSLNSSKIMKRQQNSQSLLRLSCSSYSQILQHPNHTLENMDSLSQTYSLQLKKEESFLREYGNDVSRSIILGKYEQKQMKNVRSNYDLLTKDIKSSQIVFKSTKSNIFERECPSPTITRLKNFYGDNLLNFYDQDTIISKSFVSRSNESKEKKHIIDESIILQHVIQDKFTPIMNKVHELQDCKIFLAREQDNKLLVCIKEISIHNIEKINQEISIYKEMESKDIEAGIHKLYQVYIHGNIYVLVKEPYQYTCKEYILKKINRKDERQVNLFIKNVEDSLRKVISLLSMKGIYLCKFIAIEDLMFTLGDWKCHSPDMFSSKQGEETSIPMEQALEYVKEDILNCLRKNHF